MVFWGLWAGSVLLYASYTALLTSRLAVVPQTRPFKDVYDALTSEGYSIAVQGGSSYLLMMEVCVCVCVCVRERKNKENGRSCVEIGFLIKCLQPNVLTIIGFSLLSLSLSIYLFIYLYVYLSLGRPHVTQGCSCSTKG